ncbi:MAG: FHA domain-containing protein [bacterium]
MKGEFNMVRRILSFLNIPGHIKKIVLKSKINRKKKNKRDGHIILKFINYLLFLSFLTGLVYINYIYSNNRVYIPVLSFMCLISFFIIYRIYKSRGTNIDYNEVSKLVMKDNDGQITKEWEIANNISCLIGKKTKSNEVNIDLSEAVYSSLISREHAVLNNTGKKWYFEDVGSSNGSGIKRRGESKKFKVEIARPYEIGSGDIIYIANTKLFIR